MKKKSQYETPEQFKSQEESEKGQRESNRTKNKSFLMSRNN